MERKDEPVSRPFTDLERERINAGIKARYAAAAQDPAGKFKFPVGREALTQLQYDPAVVSKLPEQVLSFYCGVGNPFSLGPLRTGDSVLDIGCGAGVDTLIAAVMVGTSGRAAGVDLVPEMVGRARENLAAAGLGNVTFDEASGEKLPFADDTFDAVISNGVFNLLPDKRQALKEVHRVLKPGGRMMIADQILTSAEVKSTAALLESWAR